MTPTISGVWAREILDSGGRPTVEVDLELTDRSFARASVPAGTSTGRHEARELRDNDPARFEGEGVLGAVQGIRETIGPALLGRSPFEQAEIDAFLVAVDGTDDKSVLGANAVLAVSMAVARAAAISNGVPLWQQLGGNSVLPLPMVNIISGGLHGDTRLAFQDFLVVPIGAETLREALECVSAVRTATGPCCANADSPPSRRRRAASRRRFRAPRRRSTSLSRRSHDRADHCATRSRSPSTSPRRISSTAPSIACRTPPTGIDADGLIGRLERLTRRLPDRFDRRRTGRG